MANNQHKHGAFYLDQSTLQCKAGCGFFGNPEWMGYCSICFKQLNNNRFVAAAHPSPSLPVYSAEQTRPGHMRPDPMVIGTANRVSDQSQWTPQRLAPVHEPSRTSINPSHTRQTYYSAQAGDYPIQQITRSASHMLHRQSLDQTTISPSGPIESPTWHLSPQTSDEQNPASSDTFANNAASYLPFTKYGEKRRTQYTDKKSNVLRLLRRASTFKDKSHSTSESPPSPGSSHGRPPALSSDAASISSEQANQSCSSPSKADSSSTITLNPGNLFSNLASPTSLVMSGYDTLTNLHNTIMNTAKSSFRVSPTAPGDTSSMHSVSQSEYMHNTSGNKSILQQPHFLYDVAWMDCLRHTNKFAKEFLLAEKHLQKNINDLSDMVHDFYQTMSDRFESQFVYKGATADQLELLNDNMERVLNQHIYHIISTRIINEDEEHNIALQRRIRSLNWITVEHLEIDIDFQHPIVHDLLDKAICQVIEMNSRTSSIDKLECIVQCSQTIFELLQVNPSSGESHMRVPVSADQFLPVLVFVVIQANPPMLPADMKYLTRFSNPRRLMSGETGYYFTNLCCALEFIEKASGASLNISEDLFQKYVNGEAVPETKSQFSTYLCDGLRTMCSNDAALKKLKHRNEARQFKIETLIEQVDVHLETNRAKLKEMQAFASSLKEKLKPNLPKFYAEIRAQNIEFARRLLPSYLRQSIEMSLEPAEGKLVDIESLEAEDKISTADLIVSINATRSDNEGEIQAECPLSPVEQIERDIFMLKLPEPLQPELSQVNVCQSSVESKPQFKNE